MSRKVNAADLLGAFILADELQQQRPEFDPSVLLPSVDSLPAGVVLEVGNLVFRGKLQELAELLDRHGQAEVASQVRAAVRR